jgi:GT2 family glycosyltransferase/tetratricopeptide (TPR) repeat protein
MLGSEGKKLRRRADLRAQLAAANAARNRGDWLAAAAHFAAAIVYRPDDHFLRMKHAKALANSGDMARAAVIYREAIILKPERPEGHFELGLTLRAAGRRDEALESLTTATRLSRIYLDARRELITAGGADRLSDQERHRVVDLGGNDAALTASGLASFRRYFPVLPPPSSEGAELSLVVLVDDPDTDPAALRATLLSLIEQRHGLWNALVLTEIKPASHPVHSLAEVDPRISFGTSADPNFSRRTSEDYVVSLSAGTTLDITALSWLAYAAARTSAAAIYADHELTAFDWRNGRRSVAAALQSMPDPEDLATTPEPPAVALVGPGELVRFIGSGIEQGFEVARQRLFIDPAEPDRIAHIPRILAARALERPLLAVDAPRTGQFSELSQTGQILVVIPTRDGGHLLRTCVASLKKLASKPDRITFLIVDNGSRDPQTVALLARLSKVPRTEVLRLDQPFNWSRLNNLAAANRTHPTLVFVNDDTEMLSSGWDNQVQESLARPSIGIVGARLLYPDGTIQHAGLALGVAAGMPIHEGLRVEANDGGPLDRWRRRRSVAAVTGAFLAIRRDVFESVGGFDDVELAVAYNDIDLCLKVREGNLRVLYEPAIELLHHESVSRGRNDNTAKIAWDHGELASLHRRWGDALFRDPGRNPQWANDRLAPFDGFRDMSPSAVSAHIEDSVQNPWKVMRVSKGSTP